MQEIVAANSRTRQEWAEVINADWRKSIESIIQTGRDLIAAKAELGHGAFSGMIENDLDFSPRMAETLMEISRHPEIANANICSDLPARWTVLRSLAKLAPDDFRWAKERGLITPDTTVAGAEALRHAVKPGADVVGTSTKHARNLPSPADARDIARETGRFVAASDGRVYSGATEEEEAETVRITGQTYGVIDAVTLLAKMQPPADWLAEAPDFQLRDLTYENVEAAAAWLLDLATAMEAGNGE